ncbi:hypothetical protein GUJ93_ZPchr0002g25978 [Zizania palustris]|uniref:Uncharacterized protein n=1 Tax=Zizania palustris TaxID=103762 RepID=A0A8J5VEG5_ZIZPA|nr:hypothetical protein GUJ93_ZPchr0002g25978 [Zizania palustris]
MSVSLGLFVLSNSPVSKSTAARRRCKQRIGANLLHSASAHADVTPLQCIYGVVEAEVFILLLVLLAVSRRTEDHQLLHRRYLSTGLQLHW